MVLNRSSNRTATVPPPEVEAPTRILQLLARRAALETAGGFPDEWDGDGRAVVAKDAGCDPESTEGARMTAEVRIEGADSAHVLHAGEGIGRASVRRGRRLAPSFAS